MLKAKSVLDNYYLDSRCALLELGATLDRFDRAPDAKDSDAGKDPRLTQLYDALSILSDKNAGPDRAERLLNLFSDPA